MNSLHLVRAPKALEVPPRPCQVGAWLRARDVRTVWTLPGGHLLSPWPPAQGSLLLCTVQWCLCSIGCARTARGLSASFSRHGWAQGQQPSPGSHHGGQAQKGARDTQVQRDSVPRARQCLPGWHAASRLTGAAPKVTDPLDTALLSRAGTQISPITSLGTLSTSPQPGPSVPAALQPDPASKCLSKLTGCKLFLPFSCYSSLAGHRSEQLLPRTLAGGAGRALILGARSGEQHPSEHKGAPHQQRREQPGLLRGCSLSELSLQRAELSQGGGHGDSGTGQGCSSLTDIS